MEPLRKLDTGSLMLDDSVLGFPVPLHTPLRFHVVCTFRARLQHTGTEAQDSRHAGSKYLVYHHTEIYSR